MSTVSTPVSAWVATILTGAGANVSTHIYVTVNITAGWEAQVPIRVQMSNVSADPVVNVFSLTDGTAAGNYDTTPFSSFSIARISGGGVRQATIRLSTGQYLIDMLASGSSSQYFWVLTQMHITSILNA